jgi:hypothetical protein
MSEVTSDLYVFRRSSSPLALTRAFMIVRCPCIYARERHPALPVMRRSSFPPAWMRAFIITRCPPIKAILRQLAPSLFVFRKSISPLLLMRALPFTVFRCKEARGSMSWVLRRSSLQPASIRTFATSRWCKDTDTGYSRFLCSAELRKRWLHPRPAVESLQPLQPAAPSWLGNDLNSVQKISIIDIIKKYI